MPVTDAGDMGALEDADPCAGCGLRSPSLRVTWCPAWSQYLCGSCRHGRTEADLGATERANAEARLDAKKRASVP